MSKIKVGFAMCGSFCTFSKAIEQMEFLSFVNDFKIIPIMSKIAAYTNTRFGKSKEIKEKIEEICKHKIITTIEDAEPIGPKAMTDIMLIAPCTGNTLGKLSYAITDTSVTMAAKSHLRQQKPLLIALATNDALGSTAQNLGRMMNVKNVYFVPLSQDDPSKKPNSLVAHFDLIPNALEYALKEEQIEPVFLKSTG